MDVRRRYRKREHDNQSGCTRGKREVESPVRHEAAVIKRQGRENGMRRRRIKMRHSNQPVRTKGGGRGWTR